jgi:hypothetical protein
MNKDAVNSWMAMYNAYDIASKVLKPSDFDDDMIGWLLLLEDLFLKDLVKWYLEDDPLNKDLVSSETLDWARGDLDFYPTHGDIKLMVSDYLAR